MKKITALLFCVSIISAAAQEPFRCATDEMMKKQFDLHPEIYEQFKDRQAMMAKQDAVDFQNGYKNTSEKKSGQATNAVVYIIPVVFHVLHNYGIENISDAQIYDQMNILNNDYRKLNADTTAIVPAFKNVAADVSIEFRLARLDPNGNCTNGITRHFDPETDWSGSVYNYSWPCSDYLNVYVVRSMANGAAGYTYLPGSVPDPYDAIVILNSYVGSIGSSSPLTSRALTHEIGHWFNLMHVWGGTNQPGVACGDDGVSDTPITKGYYSNCALSNCKICNTSVEENVQNYMEYSYCSNMFTAGQATRMRTSATSTTAGRNNLWSTTNLTAAGVNPVGSACAPIADFSSDKKSTCINSPVSFSDISWNGQPTSWSWSFPGGNPSVSTDSFPVVSYSAAGVYPVSFTVSNTFGTDAISRTSYITVFNSTATYTNGWQESFETSNIPNADWTILNPDGGVTWTRNNSAAVTGTHSMFLQNTSNNTLSKDEAISPTVDVANVTNPSFTFKVAYAQTNSSQMDFLKVYSSINCGNSWSLKYSKSGQALQTLGAGVYQSSPFTPTATQWRTETVSLGAQATSTIVLWKFVFVSDTFATGNNIYIDDINLLGSVGIENEIENTLNFYVAPNPSDGNASINFYLINKTQVKIEVSDMLGRKIETPANSMYGPGEHKLNIGENINYPAGIYFVNLHVGDKIFVKKIIIE